MRSRGVAGIPKVEGRDLRKLTDHIRVIVCNLHCASECGVYIAFQRAGGAYKADPAYRGFQFSSLNIRRVTTFLHDSGYIEWKKGYPGSRDWAPQLYKMRATPRLLDLLEHEFQCDPGTIFRDTTHVESVIVKGKKMNGQHRVITTPEKPAVRQMRANLATLNRVIRDSRIDLDLDLHELGELNEHLAGDPDKYIRPIDFTRRNLYRVFLDGSLKVHGRFYGGWWEGIPEKYRERITIDGNPTVELDYKSIHPYILYGLEEIQPEMDDLYYLQNESAQTNQKLRPLVQRFFLIMLNASNEVAAVMALRTGMAGTPSPFDITTASMRPIIEQLRRQHAPIAHNFFKGCGNMLMHYDSQMAEEVMLHFAAKNVACLPVHDSFIVEILYATECWDVMRQAYHRRFGQQIPVDVIDTLAQAQKILDGPRVVQQSDLWREMERDLVRDLNE